MANKMKWAVPSALIATALAQHGCGVCKCVETAPAPGAAIVAAASSEPAPNALAGSAAYDWKNVVILGGGFVTGVIFSPVEKDLIYARTDVGGAYRFNPADKTWIPLNDDAARKSDMLGIESLAADPVDANKVYIAVGMYTGSWAGYGSILRSKDRGNTWERTDLPLKMGGNEEGRANGERLAIDPHKPDIIYFGSRKNGLWKSSNGGVDFDQVKGFTAKDSGNGNGIPLVFFDKASGSKDKPTPVIYACVSNKDGSLYRSRDAGETWALVPKQPTAAMITHAELDATGTMYMSYGDLPGPNGVSNGAVWKYEPKKEKFTNITPLAPKEDDKFGYGGLSVSASKPGVVMVSTIDRWSKGDEVFRSHDGGKTWKALFPKVVRDDDGAKYLTWHKDEPIGRGWMGDIDIDPFNPARAMYVTGQGIWASENADEADKDKPTRWTFLDRGLEETVINSLVSPPAGPPLLSAMGDLCGFRHDDLGKPTAAGMFNNPICGSGTGIDIAWGKPDVVARVGWPGWVDKQWGGVSLDGGKTWTAFKTQPKKGKGAGNVAVTADGSTVLYAPKNGEVVFSKDNGATWTPCEGLPEVEETADWAPAYMRIAADRVNPKKVYVLDAKGGQAFYSEDGGARFTASSSGLPNMADYEFSSSSAAAVPGIEGDVWVTTGKELNHSTDSGKSYETVESVVAAHHIGFGKAMEGKKYPAMFLIGKVGDVEGFFRSDDAARTWVRINDDKHNWGFCNVIIGDPRVPGRVYIGTGGRGIIYGDPK